MIISLDKFKKNAGGSSGIDLGSIGYGKDDNAAVSNKLMEGLNLGHSETLFSNWDKNNTSAYNLYAYDYDLRYAPAIDTSNVHTMEGMFRDCANLIYVPKYDMSNVRDTTSMFMNCGALENMPEIDMTNIQSATAMFMNCGSLKEIRLTGNPEAGINATQMFDGCSANIMFPDTEQFAQVKANAEEAGCILSPYLPNDMIKASFYLSGANGYQDVTSYAIYWGTDTSNINNPMIYVGNGDWKATLPEGTEGPIYFESSAYGFNSSIGNGNASIMPGEIKEFSDLVPITIPNTYVADYIQSASDANGVTGVSGGMTIRQSSSGDWMTLNIPVDPSPNGDSTLYKFRFDIMLNAISQIRIYTKDYFGTIYFDQTFTLDDYVFEFTIKHSDIFASTKYSISDNAMNMTIEVLNTNIIQWTTLNVETIMSEKPTDTDMIVRNILYYDVRALLKFTDESWNGHQLLLSKRGVPGYDEYLPLNVDVEDGKLLNSYIIHKEYKTNLDVIVDEDGTTRRLEKGFYTPNGTPLAYYVDSYANRTYIDYNQCYVASENVEYDAETQMVKIYKGGWVILKCDNIPYFSVPNNTFRINDEGNWNSCTINNVSPNSSNVNVFFGKYFLIKYNENYATSDYVTFYIKSSYSSNSLHFVCGKASCDQLMHPMFAHVKVDISTYVGTTVTDAELDASRVTICGYPAKYAFCSEGYGSWKSWTIADDIPSYIVAKLTDNRDICIDGEVVGTVNIDPDSASGSLDSIIFEPSNSGDSTANTYHLIAENPYDMEHVEDDWYRVSVTDINTNANIAKNLVVNKEDGSTIIEKMFGAEGEPSVGDEVGLVNVKYPASESFFTIKTTGTLYVWFNEKQNLIAFTDTDDFKTMVNMEIAK